MKEILVYPKAYDAQSLKRLDEDREKQHALNGIAQKLAKLTFPFGLRIDTLLDVNVCQEGLARTLADFPLSSGRIVAEANGNMVIGKIGSGASLQFQTFISDNRVAPDGDSVEGYWISEGLFPETDTENNNNNEQTSVDVLKSKAKIDTPFVVIRLTHYAKENVSILGFSLSHAIGDRTALFMFVSTFSHHCDSICTVNEGTKSLHPFKGALFSLPVDKNCNKRSTTREELYSRWNISRFGRNPLDTPEHLLNFPSGVQSIEVRISNDALKNLKSMVTKLLPEGEDEWLSSMECLAGTILTAYCSALLQSKIPENLGAIINLRKANVFALSSSNYFGNFISMPQSKFVAASVDASMSQSHIIRSVLENSQALHQLTQECISSPENVAAEDCIWLNAAAGLGLGIYDWFLCDALDNQVIFVNSVAKFDWFGLKMGTDKYVSAFGEGRVTLPNFFRIIKHQKSTWTTKLAFREHDEVIRFEQLLKRIPLPMEVLKDNS